MIFSYTNEDLNNLRKKDKKLAEMIDLIGPIERSIEPDLFLSLVGSIVAQQISGKAYESIFNRLKLATPITPDGILSLDTEAMRACGLSYKKVEYVKLAATYFMTLDMDNLPKLSNEGIIERLTQIKGVGRWTAEMLLIFSLNRLDVFSKQDLGIQRGISMLYHHKTITEALMTKYEKRYHPYGSIAALYLWEISTSKYGHKDFRVKKK